MKTCEFESPAVGIYAPRTEETVSTTAPIQIAPIRLQQSVAELYHTHCNDKICCYRDIKNLKRRLLRQEIVSFCKLILIWQKIHDACGDDNNNGAGNKHV